MTTARSKVLIKDNNNSKNANNNQLQTTAAVPPVQKKTSLDKFLASGRTATTVNKDSSNKRNGTCLNRSTSNRSYPTKSLPTNNPYKTSTAKIPCSGFFSPFPHGTSALSVSQEYLALPDGSGGFRQDSTCPALLRILLGITQLSPTGLSPPLVSLSKLFS